MANIPGGKWKLSWLENYRGDSVRGGKSPSAKCSRTYFEIGVKKPRIDAQQKLFFSSLVREEKVSILSKLQHFLIEKIYLRVRITVEVRTLSLTS